MINTMLQHNKQHAAAVGSTFVAGVRVFGVERVQQVDGAGGSGLAVFLLLMVPRAEAVFVQLALAMPQMPGQTQQVHGYTHTHTRTKERRKETIKKKVIIHGLRWACSISL